MNRSALRPGWPHSEVHGEGENIIGQTVLLKGWLERSKAKLRRREVLAACFLTVVRRSCSVCQPQIRRRRIRFLQRSD